MQPSLLEPANAARFRLGVSRAAWARTLAWLFLALLTLISGARAQDCRRPPAEPLAGQASEPISMLRIETGAHAGLTRAADTDAAARVLVTASHDKTARIWSLPRLEPLGTFRPPIGRGNEGKLNAVAVTPDGCLAAVTGWIGQGGDYAVLVFDVATQKVLKRLGGLPNVGLSLAFSRDGKYLAAGLGGANGIVTWETSGWQPSWSDGNYDGGVNGLSFASDGRLATASVDGGLRLYDPAGRLLGRKDVLANQKPYRVAFNPEGSLLAVGFANAARLEVRDGRTLAGQWNPDTAGLDRGNLPAVAWSADGRTLFAPWSVPVSDQCPVFAWDVAGRGPPRAVAQGSVDRTFALLALPSNQLVLVSSRGALSVADASGAVVSQRPVLVQDLNTPDALDDVTRKDVTRKLLLSPDGRKVAWVARNAPNRWLSFDISRLQVDSSRAAPSGLADWSSRAGSVQVSHWSNGLHPLLNGHELRLAPDEHSQSVSVRPKSVLVGGDRSLRLFDAEGHPRSEVAVPGIAWRLNQSQNGQLAVAALDDGTVRWYRLPDLEELAALFVAADGQHWVAWTPSGYYYASPGAEDLIGWQVNRGPDQAADYFTVTQFPEPLHRREVILRVLTTLDEGEAVRQANLIVPQPVGPARPIDDQPAVVKITSASRVPQHSDQARIAYTLRSPSGTPVRSIEAIVDYGPNGARGLDRPQLLDPNGASEGEVTVSINPTGSARIRLLASTETGRKSESAEVFILGEVAETPASVYRGQLHALVVGPSYGDRELQAGVRFVERDAAEFSEVLRAQKRGVLYDDVHVTPVVGPTATREKIIGALDKLVKEATSEDTVVLFLAGHGKSDEDGAWFLPADAPKDEDKLHSAAINGTYIKEKLEKPRAKKIIVFIDTCYAGSMIEFRDIDQNKFAKDWANRYSSRSNFTVFVASTGTEKAAELDKEQHGAFTAALLEALRGGAGKQSGGIVTLSELGHFLIRRVEELTKGSQHAAVETRTATVDYPLFTTVPPAAVLPVFHHPP